MVTTASKFFYAGAFAALVASYVYGIGTDGDFVGVVTMGLKGPVGELAGYTVLQTVAAVLLALGIASSVLRDADPEVQAAAARLETLPPVTVPTAVSYWPVLGALGAVLAAVGLVASPVLFVIGLLGVLLVVLEWMVSAWSERATGDPSANRQIRNRLMYPIEIPVGGALAALVLVVSFSRVFLAVSRIGSSVVAIVLASFILLGGFLVAYRPKLGKNAIAGILTVFALVAIGGGIVGAVSGSREFEPHAEDHSEGHAEEEHREDEGTHEGQEQGDDELAPGDEESEG